MLKIICFAIIMTFPAPILALQMEGAGGYFWDDSGNVFSLMTSGVYNSDIFGPMFTTSTALGYTLRRQHFNEPETSPALKESLKGAADATEHRVSGSIDQSLWTINEIGLRAGFSQSVLGNSSYYGAGISRWWLFETLRTRLDVRKTTSDQYPLDMTDVDGHRVRLPESVEGTSLSFESMYFATPTTILRLTGSQGTRSDRPPAQAIGLEVRQYITPANGAIHGIVQHYENLGEIKPITTYGEVTANSLRLEWHQKLKGAMILMGGYRYYLEREIPRAQGAEPVDLGSDEFYGQLRKKLSSGRLWTETANELYIFGGRYSTNVPSVGYVVGVGGKANF